MIDQEIRLYLYSELPKKKIESGGFMSITNPNEWITEKASRKDGKLRAIGEGNKLLVVPSNWLIIDRP